MATETERTRPKALFMAFGTQGDVYPIAAIAAAFACDQKHYIVFLVTHSAHQNMGPHLAEKHVTYVPVSSPPVFSVHEDNDATDTLESSFSLKKRMITAEHRRESLSTVESIFGHDPSMEGDFILINFFALEGWNLAELFCIRCVVAAPYVVPYSAPASFERHFKKDIPHLYKYLQEAPTNKVCWKDVIHWMWPLFTEHWGSWRNDDLNLSPCPFTDPVTGLPTWHDRPSSPLLLYGFSKAIVECPALVGPLSRLDYWPENVHICGFWFLPIEWQFSCKNCGEASSLVSSGYLNTDDRLCSAHIQLLSFVNSCTSMPPIFIGLSSIGSMGYMKNPQLFLQVLQTVLEISSYRFILFTAAYEPLDAAIEAMADKSASNSSTRHYSEAGTLLFDSRLFCFSGTIPYRWLFPRCAAAIHHGGSGSTAAALHAGIPQVLCPFMLDQFYWAERMYWLGVGPEPLRRNHLLPDTEDDVKEAANVLSRAIRNTLSPRVKARSLEIAERISLEDGVLEAVKKLKEEMGCSN